MCCCGKSSLFTRNASSQLLAIGDTIDTGITILKTGNGIYHCGNGIVINGDGNYRILASVTAAPTGAGTITVTAYENGIAIPSATASATAGAGEQVALPIVTSVTHYCPKNSRSVITFVVTGAAGTVSNISVDVEKI